MPLKKSKKPSTPKAVEKNTFTCSEISLEHQIAEFARSLNAGDLVFLEGEMGAGKSTLARAILRVLGVGEAFQGSPTFAIVHEYHGRSGVLISHIDVYRLKSEAELESSGVLDALSSDRQLVFVEWMSMFHEIKEAIVAAKKRLKRKVFQITLAWVDEPQLRQVTITRL